MKLIRIKQVRELTGISRTYIYSMVKQGTFPAPVSLSRKSKAWISEEVIDWIQTKIDARDKSNEQESA
jgi:prophage regulatory protein